MDKVQELHNISCPEDNTCGQQNRTLVIKTFGSDKFICETYGVAGAKEQVRMMDGERTFLSSTPIYILIDVSKNSIVDSMS